MKLDKLSLVGSLLTAFLASACCTLPAILTLIGIGGGFISLAFIEKYRLPLMVLSVLFLSISFYLTYRKNRSCECEGSCSTKSSSKTFNKIILWVSVIAVVFFFAFPYMRGMSNNNNPVLINQRDLVTDTIILKINGMTCGGCEASVEKALKGIKGLIKADADYENSRVTLLVDKSKREFVATMAKSKIIEAGYEVVD